MWPKKQIPQKKHICHNDNAIRLETQAYSVRQ